MSLIDYKGDSKLLKRICALLKVTDVQENGVSIVDSDGIAHVTGGGGGSSTLAGLSDVDTTGTSDGDVLAYNDTTHKWEDKTLTIPDELADLTDDATHRLVTDTEKTTWSAKVSDNPIFTEPSTRTNISSGETFAVILGKIKKYFTDLKAVAFSNDYADLDNLPTIPAAQVNSDWNATSGVAQILNKPTIPAAQVNSDWSASSGVAQILNKPTALSSFTNDQGFITSSVNNLTNYYLKSETYTKAEVNTLIGQISTISILVVQTLPTQDIQTNIIYLVPKSTAGTSNAYDEYINTDGTSAGWELIGDTEVDLSNYYTKSEVDTLIGSVSGGHTIKNDSGTALAQKDNLKFAGTYSVNSGDDSVVNIVRTVNSESAISQMSAAEKKGIIVVDDGQAEEIDAYDVPYGNSDVGTALDGKVNTSDIVDNLTTNDATKPLSAKQGKVLKEVYTRVGSVVRPDSTYTTLLSYINGYVVSLDRQEYTFACEGFSDMPRTDWSYDCTVTRGAGLTVRLHRILSNNEDWIREIDFSSQWADSWRRAIYDNYVDEEIIAFTNTKCNTVYEIRCRKVGNVVSISTVIQPSQDIAANEILTNQIPARFRPTHNYAYFVSSNNIIIQVYGDGTMGTSNISAAIPANWYYPVNMVYIR